ncbi:YciI family protein [Snodgrassella sp. B3088]|uniref:YciI family protein n=1 Tax=Snodgrassella sp. B3088 TaxID=2818038 RepID=UPI00226A3A69|nr:YciI family protein [Snodgrassella sp. B3088]MCX8749881.1 YciI family protein [Snodgrassella sp. B3088]
MLFMLMATDADNSHEARIKARPRHLARLQELQAQNRLVLAGPNPLPDDETRFSGSLVIADFESLDEAQAWAEQDPYVDAGVYEEILIRPFKKVLPDD